MLFYIILAAYILIHISDFKLISSIDKIRKKIRVKEKILFIKNHQKIVCLMVLYHIYNQNINAFIIFSCGVSLCLTFYELTIQFHLLLKKLCLRNLLFLFLFFFSFIYFLLCNLFVIVLIDVVDGY